MNDPYNLQRFVEAQSGIYDAALVELLSGKKQSHWIWFIFPQLRGLGLSSTSRHFAIASVDEARAYLDHPILGARLSECIHAILAHAGERSAEQIVGSVDAMKLKSSLTLFDKIQPDGLFAVGLAAFFAGDRDPRTLALLNPGQ